MRSLIAASDVVLAVGTEFGPTDYSLAMKADFPSPAALIRIDIDSGQLTRGATPTGEKMSILECFFSPVWR